MQKRTVGRVPPLPHRATPAPRAAAARPPAAAIAHERIRASILRGELPPGSVVSDHELAREFGVSRTPVREAFLRLQLEGLVEVVPQVGTFVSRLDRHAVRDALFAREQLECGALAERIDAIGPIELAELDGCARRQRSALQATDYDAVMAEDDTFHFLLLRLAGRSGVWPVVRDVRDLMRRVRALALPNLSAGRSAIAQHDRIVDALRRGHNSEAVALLRTHIRDNAAMTGRLAARFPDYFTEDEG
jgi:DNA-binding GntR family transcriptional regulator